MKTKQIYIAQNPNSQITIVGQDRGTIDARCVEATISYSEEEAKDIVQMAKAEGRYVPFMSDNEKIKTIIVSYGGRVYPSSFSIDTLKKRIKEASENPDRKKRSSTE